MDELEEMLKAVFNGTGVRVFSLDEAGIREVTNPQPVEVTPDLVERFPKWRLVDVNSNQLIPIGEILRDSDGDEWLLVGARPPHKPESTGRVYVERVAEPHEERGGGGTNEFFPSVFDLQWFHITEVSDES